MKSHSHSLTHTHTHTRTHTHMHARVHPSRLSTAKVTDVSLPGPLRPAQAVREAQPSDSGSGTGGRLHLLLHENHAGAKVAGDGATLKGSRTTPAHTARVRASPQAVSGLKRTERQPYCLRKQRRPTGRHERPDRTGDGGWTAPTAPHLFGSPPGPWPQQFPARPSFPLTGDLPLNLQEGTLFP